MPVSISPVEKEDEPLVALVDVVAAPSVEGAAEAAAIEEASAPASASLTTPFASAPPPSPPIDSVPLLVPEEAPPRSALASDTATATRRAVSTSTLLPPPPAALARAASAAAAAAAASSAAAVASSSSAATSTTLSSASGGVSSFEHTHLATYLVLCFAVACVMHDSTQVRGKRSDGERAREEERMGGHWWRKSRPCLCHTCERRGVFQEKNSTSTIIITPPPCSSLVNIKKHLQYTGHPPKV